MSDEVEKTVVALVEDLIFASRIGGVAKALGVNVELCRTAQSLEEKGKAAHTAIVDLTVQSDDLLDWAKRVKASSSSPTIIGFLPHVEKDLANRARAAGVDRVMPRSEFVKELPDILAACGRRLMTDDVCADPAIQKPAQNPRG